MTNVAVTGWREEDVLALFALGVRVGAGYAYRHELGVGPNVADTAACGVAHNLLHSPANRHEALALAATFLGEPDPITLALTDPGAVT